MVMSDFEKDSDCIAFALEGWANWIETGDISLCREDVIRMVQSMKSSNKEFEARQKAEIFDCLKSLDHSQQEFVARLRALARKARSA